MGSGGADVAAVTLDLLTPTTNTLPVSTSERRRVVMPSPAPQSRLRVFSASECYVELVDAADESASGTPAYTIPPGADTVIECLGGNALAITGSTASQSVRLTALPKGREMAQPFGPQVARLASTTPDSDPNSVLGSISQDANGWIDVTVDASIGSFHFANVGAAFAIPLLSPLGDEVTINMRDLIWMGLEVEGLATDVGVSFLLSDAALTTGSHIGLALDCDGTGWQAEVQRAGVSMVSTGSFEATGRRAHLNLATNATEGSQRAQGVALETAAGAYVDGAAALSALTAYTGMDRLWLAVTTPGGTGTAAESFRFRASSYLMPAPRMFGLLP